MKTANTVWVVYFFFYSLYRPVDDQLSVIGEAKFIAFATDVSQNKYPSSSIRQLLM